MTWNCIPNPVFAWYWNYPSKTSCKSVCNIKEEKDSFNINYNTNITDKDSNNTKNSSNADKNEKENKTKTIKKKQENYFDYANATTILNKIKKDLDIKDDGKEEVKTDCACDFDCQSRGNCCYDFDLYCLNSN